METRKLIKFGNSSHVLSIPHKWLKENNLNKGDIVYVSRNGNGELVIAPEKKEVKKELKVKNLNIDGKDIRRIQRELTSIYLNDYNIIKIHGKELEEKMISIRPLIHDLLALEILEQNKNNVVARDFLNLENISLKKLINKMDMITRSTFSEINFSITKKQCDNIIDRDKDLNRIFFLAMRAIKSSLDDVELRKKLNYSTIDLFYFWHMIYHIESIADKLKGLSWFFSRFTTNKKLRKIIFDLYKKLEKYYTDSMKSYYSKSLDYALNLSCIKNELVKECDNLLKKKNLDKVTIRTLDKFKTVIIKIHNISRGVYNNYF